MLLNIIGCYTIISQLASPLELPKDSMENKVQVCQDIVDEAYKQANEDILDIIKEIFKVAYLSRIRVSNQKIENM